MGVGPSEDALDGQGAAVVPALGQELRQRRSAGQAAEALVQCRVDPRPRLAGGAANRAGLDDRVIASRLAVGISPRKDLLDVQSRQVLLVADAPLILEQVGQRRTALQAAVTLMERAVNLCPVQYRVVAHPAGLVSRPRAGGGMVGVDPGQNQVDRKLGSRPRLPRAPPRPTWREILGLPRPHSLIGRLWIIPVADTPLGGQQFGQRRTTREPAPASPQARVDR